MRTAVSIVTLAVVTAGAVLAHGVLGNPNVAGAAEAVTTIIVEDVQMATTASDPATSETDAAAVKAGSSAEGIAASASQRLAAADRWGMQAIDVAGAWDTASAFSPVIVAVLDTGIDPEAGCAVRVKASIDFTGQSNTSDEHGHGTHMTDTIACIAPNASFVNLKVADKRGRCDSSTVAKAVRWAADRGAQVINISLEVANSDELQAAVAHAWARGAVVVAAAGNSGSSAPAYPAAYEQSIAVAGTNRNDGVAVLSNHGDWVDISAPGFKIYAEALNGYDLETGTSPAAAHVSGVAALLYGIAADANGDGHVNDEVREALESSASALPNSGMGHGLVNAEAAVAVLPG